MDTFLKDSNYSKGQVHLMIFNHHRDGDFPRDGDPKKGGHHRDGDHPKDGGCLRDFLHPTGWLLDIGSVES